MKKIPAQQPWRMVPKDLIGWYVFGMICNKFQLTCCKEWLLESKYYENPNWYFLFHYTRMNSMLVGGFSKSINDLLPIITLSNHFVIFRSYYDNAMIGGLKKLLQKEIISKRLLLWSRRLFAFSVLFHSEMREKIHNGVIMIEAKRAWQYIISFMFANHPRSVYQSANP